MVHKAILANLDAKMRGLISLILLTTPMQVGLAGGNLPIKMDSPRDRLLDGNQMFSKNLRETEVPQQ